MFNYIVTKPVLKSILTVYCSNNWVIVSSGYHKKSLHHHTFKIQKVRALNADLRT